MKCEACSCRGAYRADYDAVLCNTHAEIPTYGAPKLSLREVLGLCWAAVGLVWRGWVTEPLRGYR